MVAPDRRPIVRFADAFAGIDRGVRAGAVRPIVRARNHRDGFGFCLFCGRQCRLGDGLVWWLSALLIGLGAVPAVSSGRGNGADPD